MTTPTHPTSSSLPSSSSKAPLAASPAEGVSVAQRMEQFGLVLVDILTTLRHIQAQLEERTVSLSSAEVKQTSKEVALTIKKYDNSPTPVDEAIEEFAFGMREIQRLQASNWAETVEAVAR